MFQLRTPRLLLRQWRDSDRDCFIELNADPEVMRYFPSTLDKKESNSLFETLQNEIAKNGWGFWAVEDAANKAFIGFTGILSTNHTPKGKAVEIGWRLHKDYWGLGYATEAANAALLFAFEVLNLQEVISFTTTNNEPSEAVMRRLGMSQRDENFMHPKLPADSPLSEHVLYSITASEFHTDVPVEVIQGGAKE